MESLKQLIKNKLFEIYPQEMSSLDIENFSKENGYLGETGRKRCGDLIKSGLVETRTQIIRKLDGKSVGVAFHKAVVNRTYSDFVNKNYTLEDMPEYDKYHHLTV